MSLVTIGQALQSAVEHHRAGRLSEAEKIYRKILAQQPRHAYALHMLGRLAHQTGHPEPAIELVRQAIAAKPDELEYFNTLAVILLGQRRFEEGAETLRKAIAIKPDWAEGHSNLAVALINLMRFAEATNALREAVRIRPDYAEAHANLGNALRAMNDFKGSAAAYRAALALRPELPSVREALALVLRLDGRPDEAIGEYRAILGRKDDSGDLHCSLANALSDAGLRSESQGEFRRAMELKRDDAKIHSNYLFLLQFQPNIDAATVLREHLAWDQLHAESLRGRIDPHANDRAPRRRLRIAYISPDFRNHVFAYLLPHVLESHDREQVEVYCYSDVGRPDAITQRYRSAAHHWRETAGLNDEQLAEQIHTERIDVLIDLTMHMTGNRLLTFAREPAPVQITWLAYPGTTGLSTIHYRLTDPYLDPPCSEAGRYSEHSIHLPDTFWCYASNSDEPVSDLPAHRNGYVTFGCLNNFCKVTDAAIAMWGGVMRQVERSRLILMAPHGGARERVLARLADHGIEPAQVEFVSFQARPQYLQTYRRIDIALDTVPYNGHTTSLDAMWLGVPVVTRVGETVVGRAGWSQLSNLKLTELAAAESDEQFVRIAVDLARQLDRMIELRRTLRQRMLDSPLTDAPRFARGLEAAYRTAWQRWCEGSQ